MLFCISGTTLTFQLAVNVLTYLFKCYTLFYPNYLLIISFFVKSFCGFTLCFIPSWSFVLPSANCSKTHQI